MQATLAGCVKRSNFCESGLLKKKVLGRDHAQRLANRLSNFTVIPPNFSAFNDELLSPSNINLFNRSVTDRWTNCRLLSGGSDLSPAINQWMGSIFKTQPKLLKSTQFGSLNNWSIRSLDSDNSIETKSTKANWRDWLNPTPFKIYCGIIMLTPDEEHSMDLSLFDEFNRTSKHPVSSLINREVKHHFLRSGDGVLWDESQTFSIKTTQCCSIINFRVAVCESGACYIWS